MKILQERGSIKCVVMGGSGMNGFNTTKFPWPNKVYTRPLGIESLRPFSEPSLFGRTNRLASWNGKPGMHIQSRMERMHAQSVCKESRVQ